MPTIARTFCPTFICAMPRYLSTPQRAMPPLQCETLYAVGGLYGNTLMIFASE